MNLFACLGVGPGHALLLGPLTPGQTYGARWDAWDVPEAPVAAPRARVRRSREDAAALRKRVLAALARGEQPPAIAAREHVCRTHVLGIARSMGQKRKRTTAEVDALLTKAAALRKQYPSIKDAEVSRLLGVSQAYLCVATQRRAKPEGTSHD